MRLFKNATFSLSISAVLFVIFNSSQQTKEIGYIMKENILNEIQIAFEVKATVHQRVMITHEHWDEERLLAALASGEVVTTTWHEQGVDNANKERLSIEVVRTGEAIGYVYSQEMGG